MLQITEGITANIFRMINSLAVDTIQNGREHVTDEMIENCEPEFDPEAAFARWKTLFRGGYP
ncbi:Plasmid pRM41A complete sequence (fragment) [Mesorhizobium plurifarium]|uniref:Plasmid pRM41A complete sequence n=1 Tax=Mesorhizobium plurifarium TaxID=69974 RepID=A0A090DUY2_MESPL